MFLTEESDLGSTESQPPSTRRFAQYGLQDHMYDVT
jgi:hypothetical protein